MSASPRESGWHDRHRLGFDCQFPYRVHRNEARLPSYADDAGRFAVVFICNDFAVRLWPVAESRTECDMPDAFREALVCIH